MQYIVKNMLGTVVERDDSVETVTVQVDGLNKLVMRTGEFLRQLGIACISPEEVALLQEQVERLDQEALDEAEYRRSIYSSAVEVLADIETNIERGYYGAAREEIEELTHKIQAVW